MLTEMLKIKLHNALFAAEFKPMNSFRIFWNFQPACGVTLTESEWAYSDDRSEDGEFACGDYSHENVMKLLELIRQTV